MRTQTVFAALAVLLGLMLVGCSSATISDIVQDAPFMKGEEVTIGGQVIETYRSPLSSEIESAFEVKDETGKIWVHRKGVKAPDTGRTVRIVGTVDTDFTLGRKTFKVIIHETVKQPVDLGSQE